MKNLFKLTLILSIIFLGMNSLHAQKGMKFGHINSNDLLLAMPEKDSAEKKLQGFANQLELQLTRMTQEYQKKLADYQNNPMANEVVKASIEEEIVGLQNRIQEFQANAQTSLQKKEAELMEPLVEKAKKAIKAVSTENGYTYVFDTSTGSVLHYPDGDDILPLVKKKIGLIK